MFFLFILILLIFIVVFSLYYYHSYYSSSTIHPNILHHYTYYSFYPPPSSSLFKCISKSPLSRQQQPSNILYYHWSLSSCSSPYLTTTILNTIHHHHPIYLSIIIPAWNEHSRLPIMLTDMLNSYFLVHENFFFHYPSYWEIIIVDDGSTDHTILTTLNWWYHNTSHHQFLFHLTIISLPMNLGKGHAVKTGILHARGHLVLFVDADGATKFNDIDRLLFNLLPILQQQSNNSNSIITTTTTTNNNNNNNLNNNLNNLDTWNYIAEGCNKIPAIIIGSRAHLVHTNIVVKRSILRNILMYTFHGILHILAGPIRHIGDTQCGFKLLTKAAIPQLIPGLQVNGWIFDIELLLRAYWLHIPIKEVMVTWNEINGSKLVLIRDSIHMLIDLLRLRYQYAIGNWKV